MPEDPNWYLVQTKPGRHAAALDNLRRQGVETFSPLKAATVQRFGRRQRVIEPAFPGYIFVRFDPEQIRWRTLNSTIGVSKIVSFEANRPAPVPTGLVDQLRLRCDESGMLRALDDLRPGDRVRIVEGPFADLIANVDAASGGETVRLLLSMMGQQIALTVPRESVERSGGS